MLMRFLILASETYAYIIENVLISEYTQRGGQCGDYFDIPCRSIIDVFKNRPVLGNVAGALGVIHGEASQHSFGSLSFYSQQRMRGVFSTVRCIQQMRQLRVAFQNATLGRSMAAHSSSIQSNALFIPSLSMNTTPNSTQSQSSLPNNLIPHSITEVHGSRSHYLEDVLKLPEGTIVHLTGWAERVRGMSNMMFFVLRDHTGTIQCVWEEQDALAQSEHFQALLASNSSLDPNCVGMHGYKTAYKASAESVVSVYGVVQRRPDDMIKANQKAGAVEVRIFSFRLLNEAAPMPISFLEAPTDDGSSKKSKKKPSDTAPQANALSDEDARLRYRFLDLRRPEMQRIIRTRAAMTLAARQVMYSQGFCEIETPYLVKSTPEGAREFLVPSRTKGRFYALPQSPQQHKQLLMAAGMDRYFQIARCFRDESGRQDRQPEFTQMDLELSFPTPEIVMGTIEKMVDAMHRRVYGVPLGPVPVIRYRDAMDRFGSDKPDLRYSLELKDVTNVFVEYAKKMFPHLYYPSTAAAARQPVKIDKLLADCVRVNPTFLYTMHTLQSQGQCNETGLKMAANGEIESVEGHALARHPLPVVKAVVARGMGSELSKGKNKDVMTRLLREVGAGSGGYQAVLVNTAKFAWKEDGTGIDANSGTGSDVELAEEGVSPTPASVLVHSPEYQAQLVSSLNLGRNDFVFIVAGDWERVCNGLGKLRIALQGLLPEGNEDLTPPVINGSRIVVRRAPAATESSASDAISAGGMLGGPVLNGDCPLPVFHWVTDFPLFDVQVPARVYANNHAKYSNKLDEVVETNERVEIASMHHPFTSPHPTDLAQYETIVQALNQRQVPRTTFEKAAGAVEGEGDGIAAEIVDADAKSWNNDAITNYPLSLAELSRLSQVRALHYDLVANGLEVGGGSIRIHQPALQRSVFDLLQVPHSKFHHLLEALSLGCPPHGGFAAGLDRLVAIFASKTAAPLKLRDVIAFPKTLTGNDLLLGSPNPATQSQLDEYHLNIKK